MRKNNNRAIVHTFLAVLLLTALFVFVFYQNRKHKKETTETSDTYLGADWSGYQGSNIKWDSVKSSHHPIKFIILRATRGDDRKDSAFLKNFIMAKMSGYTVGCYHYFDPNEDPKLQAKNYFQYSSILTKGDFIPIVDIEALADSISLDSLKKNLKWMMDTVEKKYGTKPILYTNLGFYKSKLKDSVFSKYPLWLAAYNKKWRDDPDILRAAIYQFTDSLRVKGVKGYIDGNDIKKNGFDSLLLKK